MDLVEETNKIIQDIIAEYKAKIFEVSAKKQKIAKAVIDRIEKDKIDDLRKILNSK